MSSPAAAINAAAFGPADAASFDQPPVSRMLTKVSCASGTFSATSRNNGASCVQATVIGAPSASAALNRSSSRPQSWFACVIFPAQPRPIASASSGMVFSQLQIRRWGNAALMVNYPKPPCRSRGCFGLTFRGSSWREIAQGQTARTANWAGIAYNVELRSIRIRFSMSRLAAVEQTLDLPPGYTLVALREAGDAFAHGCAIAAEAGAGTLVWVRRYDLVEFAVVLEPDEPLVSARRAFFAGMNALADAIAAHCPPEREVKFDWPDAILFDEGLLGGARLGWPADCAEDEVPAWLVFGIMLRAADMAHVEQVQAAAGVSLLSEGFEMADTDTIIGSFARHLMTAFDLWNERGFETIARDYLARLPSRKAGERRRIDLSGDLLITPPTGSGPPERASLVDALAKAAWYDPQARGPKLG